MLLQDRDVPISDLESIIQHYRSIKHKLDYSAPECVEEIFSEWTDAIKSFHESISKNKLDQQNKKLSGKFKFKKGNL
jgi:hypothetical protein